MLIYIWFKINDTKINKKYFIKIDFKIIFRIYTYREYATSYNCFGKSLCYE